MRLMKLLKHFQRAKLKVKTKSIDERIKNINRMLAIKERDYERLKPYIIEDGTEGFYYVTVGIGAALERLDIQKNRLLEDRADVILEINRLEQTNPLDSLKKLPYNKFKTALAAATVSISVILGTAYLLSRNNYTERPVPPSITTLAISAPSPALETIIITSTQNPEITTIKAEFSEVEPAQQSNEIVAPTPENAKFPYFSITAHDNWGFSHYALINLQHFSFDGLKKMHTKAVAAYYSSLSLEDRTKLSEETTRLHQLNLKHSNLFRKNNRNHIPKGAEIIVSESRDPTIIDAYNPLIGEEKEEEEGKIQEYVLMARSVQKERSAPEVRIPEQAHEIKINRPYQDCSGKDNLRILEKTLDDQSPIKSSILYFDTSKPLYAGLYGNSYGHIRDAWNIYLATNDISELVAGIYKSLGSLNLVRDETTNKLRTKPKLGVDNKPVPGVWVSEKELCGIVNKLRDDIFNHYEMTPNKTPDFKSQFRKDIDSAMRAVSDYKSTFKLSSN